MEKVKDVSEKEQKKEKFPRAAEEHVEATENWKVRAERRAGSGQRSGYCVRVVIT